MAVSNTSKGLPVAVEDPWQTLPLPLSSVTTSEASPEVPSVSSAPLQNTDRTRFAASVADYPSKQIQTRQIHGST
ncbi:hypothetical protein AOLI_G00071830 [Acnodon oligacanthus]